MDERDVERGRTECKKIGVGDRKKNISFWSLEQFFFQLGTRRHNNGRPASSSNKIKFTKDLIVLVLISYLFCTYPIKLISAIVLTPTGLSLHLAFASIR
jgi:hypothetical protein